MRVRPVALALAYDGLRGGSPQPHIIMATKDGRVFERFGDMPEGAWNEWAPHLLPEAKRVRRRRARSRKK